MKVLNELANFLLAFLVACGMYALAVLSIYSIAGRPLHGEALEGVLIGSMLSMPVFATGAYVLVKVPMNLQRGFGNIEVLRSGLTGAAIGVVLGVVESAWGLPVVPWFN